LENIEKNLVETELVASTDNDAEMREMAAGEILELRDKKNLVEKELEELTRPTDPMDKKDVIVEIRAGVGGDESALFSAELFRMYVKYAESKGWKTHLMDSNRIGIGGYKEVIFSVKGKNVYKDLKYEMGVHRVQRVPETEKAGRIHTSTVTVVILPEIEETELKIEPKDLRIDTFCSGGAGGQSVNTADSAVRIVHKPTGLVVECQDERSQLKNKERALKILKTRLYEKAQREQDAIISAARKSLVGSGDRSERIRTYNFPQGRLTDHRINYTVYNLPDIINGDLTDVLDKLGTFHQAELLKSEINQH